MFEQVILAERFQALLAAEQQAADAYGKLATDVSDPQLREKIQQLLADKHRHIHLAERLLEIVD